MWLWLSPTTPKRTVSTQEKLRLAHEATRGGSARSRASSPGEKDRSLSTSKTSSSSCSTPQRPASDRRATWRSQASGHRGRRFPRAAVGAAQAQARHARACSESSRRVLLRAWRWPPVARALRRRYPTRGTSRDGTTVRLGLRRIRRPGRRGWPGIPQASRLEVLNFLLSIILISYDPGQAEAPSPWPGRGLG